MVTASGRLVQRLPVEVAELPVRLENRISSVPQLQVCLVPEDIAGTERIALACCECVHCHLLLPRTVRLIEALVEGLLPAGQDIDFLLLLPVLLDLDHAIRHVAELEVRPADWISVALGSFLLCTGLVVVALEVVEVAGSGRRKIDPVAKSEACCVQFHSLLFGGLVVLCHYI